jgi:hypothetical protein
MAAGTSSRLRQAIFGGGKTRLKVITARGGNGGFDGFFLEHEMKLIAAP